MKPTPDGGRRVARSEYHGIMQPTHLSYSSLNSWDRCPKQYQLSRIIKAQAHPAWYYAGGTAVHLAAEDFDRGLPLKAWRDYFYPEVRKALAREPDHTSWLSGGSPDNPDQGDAWMSIGPRCVSNWKDFTSGVFQVDDIELDVTARLPGSSLKIKGFVDRIGVHKDHGRMIVDIKGFALNTPIPTPEGWTTMGEIRVGDRVFGADGHICRVTEKSDVKNLRCFKVTFDDTSSVVCDEEHLWETTVGYATSNLTTGIKSVIEVKDTLKNKTTGQRHHRVRLAGALSLPEAPLPIDPYLIGYWLGDGKRLSSEFTTNEPEVVSRFEKALRVSAYGETQYNAKGMRAHLRALGIFDKSTVPPWILRGSMDQRLALLQGLMDSDGTYNKARKTVVFIQKREHIARAVLDLACSLGQRAVLRTVTRTGFGVTGEYFEVSWRPVEFVPFHIRRKADQVDLDSGRPMRHRIIQSVEEVSSVPTQCIAVDSLDSMYLVGDTMIPTHNSGKNKPKDKGLQLGVYGALYLMTSGEVVNKGAYFMAREGVLSKVYEFDPMETLLDLGKKFKTVAQEIGVGEFPARVEYTCRFCDQAPNCFAYSGDTQRTRYYDPDSTHYKGTDGTFGCG